MENSICKKNVDELGRIVISLLLQEKIGVKTESYVSISLRGQKLILEKLDDDEIKKIREERAKKELDYTIYKVQDKNENVIRAIDEISRLVIPIEMRKKLGITENSQIKEYIDEGKIVLEKII